MQYYLDDKDKKCYLAEDIPELKNKLSKARKDYKNYGDDGINNSYAKNVRRLDKLIKLLGHRLNIEDYNQGTVLVNGKYIVSLSSNNWRIMGKQTWYSHKHDMNHFVCNYILKEDFQQPPTPEQELEYFQSKLREVFRTRPEWLVTEIEKITAERLQG